MPPVTSAAIPWIVANRTRPTRSGSPRLERALGLALHDQLEHHRERALGGLVQLAATGSPCLPANISSSSAASRVAKRTYAAAVACSRGSKSVARAVHGAAQLGAQPREAVLRERVEQRLAVGEVPARRGVADADLARQLAQRQLPARRARARSARPARAAPCAGCRGGRGARLIARGSASGRSSR